MTRIKDLPFTSSVRVKYTYDFAAKKFKLEHIILSDSINNNNLIDYLFEDAIFIYFGLGWRIESHNEETKTLNLYSSWPRQHNTKSCRYSITDDG